MRRQWKTIPGALLTFLIATTLACGGGAAGGGSGGGLPADPGSGALALVDLSVGDSAGVALNTVLEFEFDRPLDPDTVRPDTIRIRSGPNFGAQVPGTYETDGETVRFYPRLPVRADLSDAGLAPGRDYRVTLPGAPDVATVRSSTNDRLGAQTEVSFRTSQPGGNLFTDNARDPIPPRVVSVNPADGATGVPTAAELTLHFNRRPLHPATVTASNVHLTLVSRDGTVYERPVAGRPVLIQSPESVTVRFEPDFPLADRATYRLTVERRTQDLVGNDVEPFTSTFTTADEPAHPGEFVVEFSAAEFETLADVRETTASWSDEEPDALAALFTVAGGDGTAGDFEPASNVTVTADDFPRGVRTEVVDGVETDVFHFRKLRIPEGVTVRFAPRSGGPNRPVALLALKDVEIAGTIDLSGGRGVDGEGTSLDRSIPFAAGGRAGPGATAGADNYTGSRATNAPPADAEDVPGGPQGGRGGEGSGHSRYSWSGGGGGGASRTDGKAGTKGGYSFTASYNGAGGAGGLSPESQGLDANPGRRPNLGGAGGGAGGLGYYWPTSTNWRQAAGSGGGGGGAITIQTAGDIVFASGAQIRADGGDGGNANNRSSYYGGAGGGGGGGSVLLRGTGEVDLASGVTISVAGGKGGVYVNTFTRYRGGEGGEGGDGYLRIEAREDPNSPGKARIDGLVQTTVTPGSTTTGIFSPRGGGAPSVGQTHFVNLGVFDPVMNRPAAADVVATRYDDEVRIEVQMAVEDGNDLGRPDLSALDVTDADGDGRFDDTLDPARLSEWTPLSGIESLNGRGYSFLRVRVVFQLDANQGPDDPLPSLERLRIPYEF